MTEDAGQNRKEKQPDQRVRHMDRYSVFDHAAQPLSGRALPCFVVRLYAVFAEDRSG